MRCHSRGLRPDSGINMKSIKVRRLMTSHDFTRTSPRTGALDNECLEVSQSDLRFERADTLQLGHSMTSHTISWSVTTTRKGLQNEPHPKL